MVKIKELTDMISNFYLDSYGGDMEIVVKNKTIYDNESIKPEYDAVGINFEITKDKQRLIIYI